MFLCHTEVSWQACSVLKLMNLAAVTAVLYQIFEAHITYISQQWCDAAQCWWFYACHEDDHEDFALHIHAVCR